MSLCHSYSPNYFSINDILATQERVPCKIEVVLPRLGYLDVSSESPDLQPGTKIEFPQWLAFQMSSKQRPIVSMEMPNIYKEAYREILSADACAVDLSKWSFYFYEFGMHLTKYVHPESGIIKELLLQSDSGYAGDKKIQNDLVVVKNQDHFSINLEMFGPQLFIGDASMTFRSRFRLVMDRAQNTGTDPTIGSQLPVLERILFTNGRKARCLLVSWLKEGGGIIETSEMVANHKKRKRTEFEDEDV